MTWLPDPQAFLEQGILLQTCDLPKSHLPLHKNCSAVAVFLIEQRFGDVYNDGNFSSESMS